MVDRNEEARQAFAQKMWYKQQMALMNQGMMPPSVMASWNIISPPESQGSTPEQKDLTPEQKESIERQKAEMERLRKVAEVQRRNDEIQRLRKSVKGKDLELKVGERRILKFEAKLDLITNVSFNEASDEWNKLLIKANMDELRASIEQARVMLDSEKESRNNLQRRIEDLESKSKLEAGK